ncbi:hypothetical protein Dimus_019414 [Dionaea muscipula]
MGHGSWVMVWSPYMSRFDTPLSRLFLFTCKISLSSFSRRARRLLASLCCILDSGKYVVINGVLQLIMYTKEKNAILFTYPPPGSYNTTGLVVSSKLPRFSDMYTLSIASAEPKSISANEPVEFTKSITKWFTKDGVLVEGLLWKDVEGLIDDYAKEKKSK